MFSFDQLCSALFYFVPARSHHGAKQALPSPPHPSWPPFTGGSAPPAPGGAHDQDPRVAGLGVGAGQGVQPQGLSAPVVELEEDAHSPAVRLLTSTWAGSKIECINPTSDNTVSHLSPGRKKREDCLESLTSEQGTSSRHCTQSGAGSEHRCSARRAWHRAHILHRGWDKPGAVQGTRGFLLWETSVLQGDAGLGGNSQHEG